MKPRLANISSRGLTLIELLLVLAMIGLLVVVILPATQAVRESARRAQCASHLKQMGVALHLYHEQMQSLPIGLMPVYDTRYSRHSPRGTPDFLDRSFLVALLPQLEIGAGQTGNSVRLTFTSVATQPCLRAFLRRATHAAQPVRE